MTALMNSILIGFDNFPFFAVIFTIPLLLGQVIKHKKINMVRLSASYMFILYLLCLTAVVFLPLPTMSEAARLSTYDIQLVPFQFAADIVRESSFRIQDVHTYLPALSDFAVLQVVSNILLLMPLGMFLRYYFHMDVKKAVIAAFAVSLFIEAAQLTGMFFIYNGSYRLCDIDDLMLNTLGGFLGAQLVKIMETPVQKMGYRISHFSTAFSTALSYAVKQVRRA